MGFRERSALVCLAAILVVFVPYFLIVFRYPLAFAGLLVLAVVVLTVLLVAFHVANALATRSIRRTGDVPACDELDRMVELRAAKLSGIVMATVVMLWSLAAMLGAPALGVSQLAGAAAGGGVVTPAQFAIPVDRALAAVHVLFAGFVLANIVYYGHIVLAYRRLARG